MELSDFEDEQKMRYTKMIGSSLSAAVLVFGGNALVRGEEQQKQKTGVEKVVKTMFVTQSFDGGKSMFGYYVPQRLDREEKDIRRVCKDLDDANKSYSQEKGFGWYDSSKSEFYMRT